MKKKYTLLFSLLFILAAFKTYATQKALVTISITPALIADAGPDKTICEGNSAILEGSAEGAITYQWMPSTGLSSTTIDKPIASPTATTTYTLEVSNGINFAQDVVIVTVNELPNVIISASAYMICEGKYSMLSAASPNTIENSYVWSNGSTANNISVSPSVNASYTVTVTEKNGCSNTATVMIIVNQLPIVTITTYTAVGVCKPSFTLTGTPGSGTFSGTGVTGKTFSPSTAGIGTHTVTYTYTDFVGTSCSNSASTLITVTSCLGIAETSLLNSFNVFPNPTDGLLTIEFIAKDAFVIKLMSMSGQVIEHEQQNYQGEYRKIYDMNTYAKGMYYLQIITNEGNITRKIVLE